MNGWKWLLVSLATLLMAASAVVAALVWLVGTERGAVWLASQVDERAGAALSINGVQGTLWHGFTIQTLVVDLPGHEVRARELGVVITLRALRERRLEVQSLSAAEFSYRSGGATVADQAVADASPSADAVGRTMSRRLPVSIHVSEARVEVVSVTVDEQSWAAADTRFGADLVGDTLTITGFATEAEGLQVSGAGELSLTDTLILAAELAWSGEFDGLEWAGQGLVTGTWPDLHVWHSLAQPFDILLEGELSLDEGPAGTVEVNWTDIAIDGYEWVSSPAGGLTISGAWPSLRFDGAADLVLDGEPVSVRLSGTGTPDVITLDELAASGSSGNVSLAGEVTVASLGWDVTFAVEALDPSFRFPEWPGRLQAAGRSSGQLVPEPEWSLEDVDLDGQLRGYPFTVQGGIRHRPDVWELDSLRVQSDDNTLMLNGVYADQVTLELVAEVEEFSTLWPELRGAVSGELQIFGPRNDLQAQGTLVAEALRYREFSAERLVAVSSVDGGAVPSVELSLNGQGLSYRTADLAEATLRVSGTGNAHQLVLSAHADDWSAEAVASGALADAVWDGRVDSLVIDQAQLGQWRQQQPAALVLGRDRFRLEPVCLSQASASLCANVLLEGDDGDRLQLSAASVDARLLSPFLPQGFVVEGIYNASLNLTGRGDTLQGELSVLSDVTSFDITLSGQPVFASSIEGVNVDAVLSENALRLRAGFIGSDTGVVNIRLDADDVRAPDPLVDMQIDVLWPDLSFLALLSPDVTDVAGTLSVQLAASGRADSPDVTGRAELSGGALGVPALGLMVSDITASALSADGSTLSFDATGLIGDREVSVNGTTELDYRASFPTRLTLRGESVPAVQLPEVQVYVSPELTANVRLPEIDVSGTVHVPRARVTLQELPPQAVAPSADTVVHGEQPMEAVRPLQMRGDLRVTLGEDVRYTGMNLDTQVTGDLRLLYQSGRPLNASGALTMDGTYNAYGQFLDLERGELIFSGPLNDPALDVRAVRQINETMVGVQLTGRLQSPDTRIISSPAMSEADALAYMLFGRPMTGARGEETATLQSAALAMGLQQALPVFQRIGEAIGFDEFSVQATDMDAGALMAGKYLSSNVYLRYTYGLFNGIGGLLLRFRLSDRLSLETRSAEHKSMDLLYTVERD